MWPVPVSRCPAPLPVPIRTVTPSHKTLTMWTKCKFWKFTPSNSFGAYNSIVICLCPNNYFAESQFRFFSELCKCDGLGWLTDTLSSFENCERFCRNVHIWHMLTKWWWLLHWHHGIYPVHNEMGALPVKSSAWMPSSNLSHLLSPTLVTICDILIF